MSHFVAPLSAIPVLALETLHRANLRYPRGRDQVPVAWLGLDLTIWWMRG